MTTVTYFFTDVATVGVTTVSVTAALYTILAVTALTAVFARAAERRCAAHRTLAILIRNREAGRRLHSGGSQH